MYIRTDRAGEGIPIFQEVFSVSVLDPELRAAAAAWLLQGYLANGESEKIVPYLRYLTGNYEAIFDPKFSITLLVEGDKLFEAKDYDRAGQPDERFKLHYLAIEQLGNDLKRYSVDKLIVSYVKDYDRYMRTYEASLGLLNAMLDDDA
ncbi:hypothetical protein [Coraliomargarita parva]|uniref:hypothetical protein n=1 Tax=Coraliomargarita parva TaxID=3014050 RepID=UPI0022B48ACB|nr:hypothetical protein [Coraliomargarita parva]